MSLVRSQHMFIVLLFIFIVKCQASTVSQRDAWFKKLQAQSKKASSSSDLTRDFLQNFFPQMLNKTMQEGKLPSQQKNNIKSRSSVSDNILNLDLQPCQKMPKVHFLQQPDVRTADHFVWPYSILVPRCEGSCYVHPDITYCAPIKKQKATFTAYKIFYDGGYRKKRSAEGISDEDIVHHLRSKRNSVSWMVAFDVTIEYDAECGPKCRESHASCAAKNKVFRPDSCRCECKLVTSCPMDFEWSDDVCGCVCSYDQQIMTDICHRNNKQRKYWNHKLCACVCQKSCPNKINQTTCSCY